MQLADVIAEVQQRVGYLRCATSAPSGDGWMTGAELIADPTRLRREIDATAAGRQIDDPQVAASLFVQAYAFRAPSLAVAAFALDLPVPSTAPAVTAIRIARHRPAELAIIDPVVAPIDAPTLAGNLLDDHLGPFIESVRAGTRIGTRLLWGNTIASIATVFRAVQSTGPFGDARVRERAAAFFTAIEARLAAMGFDRLGQWSAISTDTGFGWYWDRTNCCLWYQTASGSYCDDCSFNDPAEMERKRRVELTGSAG